MAISVLDASDVPAAPPEVPAAPVRRRLPATVVGTAVVGVGEALAVLSGALTGLDGLVASASRPSGPVVALVLVALATWVVLCAGGAATLVEGAGSRIVAGVAYGELVLVAALFLAGLTTTALDGLPPAGVPVPAAALLALAVPVAKLLLVGAPSTAAWVAAGPRPRERRPDPTRIHRGLCLTTLAVIGVTLTAVALLAPAAGAAADGPGSVASSAR